MTIKRITLVQELLEFVGMKDRLHLSWISSAEAGKFVEVVSGFTETIRDLGPNPLKDFDMKPWLDRLDQPVPDTETAHIAEAVKTEMV